MRKSKLAFFFLLLLLMILLTGCGAEEALADLVDALFDIKQAARLPFNLGPLAELLSYLRPLALLAVVAFGGASLQSYFRGENVREAILSRHIKWFGVLVLLGTPPSFFNFIHQTGQGYWPDGLTTSFVAEKMGILSLALGTGPLAVLKFLFVLAAFVALVVAIASQVVIEALVLVGYPAAVVLCIGFRSLRMILCWFIAFVTWILFAPIWYRAL
jgi:hypothetical protein